VERVELTRLDILRLERHPAFQVVQGGVRPNRLDGHFHLEFHYITGLPLALDGQVAL
jgi:hypothetical protein